jgi:hypothetical protein
MMPTWLPWLQAAQSALFVASVLYTWWSNQRRADRHQVTAIEAANTLLDSRVTRLEEQVKHLPCEGQWSELHAECRALKATTENLNGWCESLARKLDRIDDWLRENK